MHLKSLVTSILVAALGVACDDAPSAVNDSAVTARGVPVIIDALANDGGHGAKITRTTQPLHGSATIRDGKVVYAPADDALTDTFDYVVTADGKEASASVEVTILPAPGTVAHGRLFTAEADDAIGWDGVNARGDRVGRYMRGPNAEKLVRVRSSGEHDVIEPPGPAADQLVRGIADDGTVVANYLHATRFQWIGFTWKDGVYDRICDLGPDNGDCTPEGMATDGTIVGTTYDYVVYTGFVWPAGGERRPLVLEGYASTYAEDIASDGTIVGNGDDSSDGYSGPSRCFAGKPDALLARAFTDGDPHFVACSATNDAGWIAGHVKPLTDATGVPRSESDRIRSALWAPSGELAYVPFPFPRVSADAWRIEVLVGMNDAGVMVGYFQDTRIVPASGEGEPGIERFDRGITLTPVEASPSTSFDASPFDHVYGPS